MPGILRVCQSVEGSKDNHHILKQVLTGLNPLNIFTYPALQEQKPSRMAQAAVAGLAALMLAAGPAISADKASLR